MAPKSDASVKAFQLHQSGISREDALERLQKDFPDIAKARRSQLLQQYWGKEAKTLSGDENSTPALISKRISTETHIKTIQTASTTGSKDTPGSKTAFAASLFTSNLSREDAMKRLTVEYPTMDIAYRAMLLGRYWGSPASSSGAQKAEADAALMPPAKRFRLHVKQGDPAWARKSSKPEGADATYIEQAIAIRDSLTELAVPGDGHCFYHCMNYILNSGIAAWRKAVAAELEQHKSYYAGFAVGGEDRLVEHIKGVKKDAWAENLDVMASANVLRRVLVIFRKNVDQRPIAILPDVPLTSSEPIYLLLDDAHPGCEHYDLLLTEEMPSTEDIVEGNQSDLQPEQLAYCQQLLLDDPLITWYMIGKQLMTKYSLKLSKPSLRRLHARLTQRVEDKPSCLTAEELQARYYDWASDVIKANPKLSWWSLRSELQQQDNVTASNGVFIRFYNILPGKCTALMRLCDLRASYTDVAMALLKQEPRMTWNSLKDRLRELHQISTHDSSVRSFYQEIQRTLKNKVELDITEQCASHASAAMKVLSDSPTTTWSELRTQLQLQIEDRKAQRFHKWVLAELHQPKHTVLDELELDLESLTEDSLTELLDVYSWTGDAKLLWKQLSCLQEWMSETKRLFSKKEPDPKTCILNSKTLLDFCLKGDRFQLWSRLLCWKFCSKCGKRKAASTDWTTVPSTCVDNCRECDKLPDFMEQATRLNLFLHHFLLLQRLCFLFTQGIML